MVNSRAKSLLEKLAREFAPHLSRHSNLASTLRENGDNADATRSLRYPQALTREYARYSRTARTPESDQYLFSNFSSRFQPLHPSALPAPPPAPPPPPHTRRRRRRIQFPPPWQRKFPITRKVPLTRDFHSAAIRAAISERQTTTRGNKNAKQLARFTETRAGTVQRPIYRIVEETV